MLVLRMNLGRFVAFSFTVAMRSRHIKAKKHKSLPRDAEAAVLYKPTRSITDSAVYDMQQDVAPGPVGFLPFVEFESVRLGATNKESEYESSLRVCDFLLYEYRLLVNLFPQFPESMMIFMFLREQGNSMRVYQLLRARGWPEHKASSIALKNQNNIHFTTEYYWGEQETQYLQVLQDAPRGSFYTALELPRYYYLYHKQTNDNIQKRSIESPVVNEIHRRSFSLLQGLPRPSCITTRKLVPFIRERQVKEPNKL